MGRRLLLVAAGLLSAAAATLAAALVIDPIGASDTRGPLLDPRKGNMDVAAARAFREFPLYALGDSVEGLPLTSIQRVEQVRPLPGEDDAPKANFVAFGYGDCEPEPCPIPVDVQVWAACERNPSVYRLDPAGIVELVREWLTVRGVPAAYYPADPRLELSTDTVTIVIFATGGRAQLLAAAAALRGVNVDVHQGERLPAPAPGATTGKLPCAG